VFEGLAQDFSLEMISSFNQWGILELQDRKIEQQKDFDLNDKNQAFRILDNKILYPTFLDGKEPTFFQMARKVLKLSLVKGKFKYEFSKLENLYIKVVMNLMKGNFLLVKEEKLDNLIKGAFIRLFREKTVEGLLSKYDIKDINVNLKIFLRKFWDIYTTGVHKKLVRSARAETSSVLLQHVIVSENSHKEVPIKKILFRLLEEEKNQLSLYNNLMSIDQIKKKKRELLLSEKEADQKEGAAWFQGFHKAYKEIPEITQNFFYNRLHLEVDKKITLDKAIKSNLDSCGPNRFKLIFDKKLTLQEVTMLCRHLKQDSVIDLAYVKLRKDTLPHLKNTHEITFIGEPKISSDDDSMLMDEKNIFSPIVKFLDEFKK
jgi:hypothetical protein